MTFTFRSTNIAKWGDLAFDFIETETEILVSVARAIFNNESEFDEELPFEKGDVLRVLSERPDVQFVPVISLKEVTDLKFIQKAIRSLLGNVSKDMHCNLFLTVAWCE
ncbi:SH3 domain protein [Necator americanus]|uniref:SH3 domain protein n=1 Tax=Necator americanus TaxID=51031 RepID=W2TTQ3_NECAM|nr:SH3 domain protein [Necator americanus]ETN84432.1 SH3 domain protein [Necator americanus]